MSKLAPEDKFLDLSDYGRPFAKWFANRLKNTSWTPIHVTLLFGVSGLIAIYCLLQHHYLLAGIFIVLKSVIDAADGELARIKKTPSYVGRYLDSVFDIVLNFLFFITICYISETKLWLTLIAFFCVQLQGTLYNYYYVILRHHSVGGDKTSKIFETETPKALAGETQQAVNILFKIYSVVYGLFDKIIYTLDPKAYQVTNFPNWFMSLVSLYGLGFQLLLIAILVTFDKIELIIPFFIGYSLLIFILIGLRKTFLKR